MPAEELRKDHRVPEAGHGEELGHALDQPEDDGLQVGDTAVVDDGGVLGALGSMAGAAEQRRRHGGQRCHGVMEDRRGDQRPGRRADEQHGQSLWPAVRLLRHSRVRVRLRDLGRVGV